MQQLGRPNKRKKVICDLFIIKVFSQKGLKDKSNKGVPVFLKKFSRTFSPAYEGARDDVAIKKYTCEYLYEKKEFQM